MLGAHWRRGVAGLRQCGSDVRNVTEVYRLLVWGGGGWFWDSDLRPRGAMSSDQVLNRVL